MTTIQQRVEALEKLTNALEHHKLSTFEWRNDREQNARMFQDANARMNRLEAVKSSLESLEHNVHSYRQNHYSVSDELRARMLVIERLPRKVAKVAGVALLVLAALAGLIFTPAYIAVKHDDKPCPPSSPLTIPFTTSPPNVGFYYAPPADTF